MIIELYPQLASADTPTQIMSTGNLPTHNRRGDGYSRLKIQAVFDILISSNYATSLKVEASQYARLVLCEASQYARLVLSTQVVTAERVGKNINLTSAHAPRSSEVASIESSPEHAHGSSGSDSTFIRAGEMTQEMPRVLQLLRNNMKLNWIQYSRWQFHLCLIARELVIHMLSAPVSI